MKQDRQKLFPLQLPDQLQDPQKVSEDPFGKDKRSHEETGISPAYPPAHKITVSFTISSV